jgi:hypothetical protein
MAIYEYHTYVGFVESTEEYFMEKDHRKTVDFS